MLILVSVALADDTAPPGAASGPSMQEIRAALEGNGPALEVVEPTNPEAAEQLPHTGLDRDEAGELLTAVFAAELEGTAGVFDELDVERFHGDHIALLAPGDQLGPEVESEGESQPTLLESTLPLRTEDENGEVAAVDLSLTQAPEGLEPANPLVDVAIPGQLGAGISMPDAGVEIRLAEAPAERAPSIIEESTAFYPNVAPDSDLTVAPTPGGVETSTQLRSADAPRTQTFALSLPEGARLQETQDGGAEVVDQEGKPLIVVPAPSALDAAGKPVPVQLETAGDSVLITATPDKDTAYPVLVDPLWEKYTYGQLGGPKPDFSGWTAETNNPSLFQTAENDWCAACGNIVWGLELNSFPGSSAPWSRALWNYHVPRWAEDAAIGKQPTTYINYAMFSRLGYDVGWEQNNHSLAYDPIFEYYLWDNNNGFVAIGKRLGTEGNLSDPTYQYKLQNPNNNENAKQAEIELVTTQPYSQWRHAYVGDAWFELTDNDYPELSELSGPEGWVNSSAGGKITFKALDAGLGVSEMRVWERTSSGALQNVSTLQGCTGGAAHPCPRSWSSTAGGPALNYNPSILPQGENWATVDAADPLGHLLSQKASKPQEIKIKVDHTAPALTVSGTLTEQGVLGTTKPEYTLKYTATDGYSSPASALAPFGSLGSGNGQLNGPRGIVADKKGHVWVVDRMNNRVMQFSESGEYLGKFGSTGTGNGQFNYPTGITLTEAGNLWVTDSGNKRVQEFNSKGEYMQQFGTAAGSAGSSGTSFIEPFAVAAAPNGMIWVSDLAGKRVGQFRENPGSSERFVRDLSGSSGSSGGATDLAGPAGLAVDPQGNVFVADSALSRIEKFNSSGVFTMQFGSLGTSEGQLKGPFGITVAPSGNLLVANTENNRIEEFLPNGGIIRKFGSLGTGNNQLAEPRALSLGAGNVLFVADKGNNRVARWSNVDLDPQSGAAKVQIKVDNAVVYEEAPGCATKNCELGKEWPLKSTDYTDGPHTVKVIATDGVGLTTTKEIPIVLNPDRTAPTIALSGSLTEQPSLGTTLPRYVLNLKATDPGATSPISFSSAFGASGTGNGQFAHPADVAPDSKGNLWIVDENNNRIQKFNEKGEFLAKYGSTGSGNGQLSRPASLAIDPKGNVWVADANNNRIEEFSESGTFLKAVGTKGTGNGQFSSPEGIAIDPKGNIWVADTYNARIQKFSESGTFLKAVGTKGTGTGQLIEPTGIDVGPGGNVWVTDWSNNKVVEFNEAGEYVRQFGTSGAGNGQFAHPDAIAVDSKGGVWVGDQGNNRVQEFNEQGEYLLKFGSAGSGNGQFNLSFPMGIGVDPKGNVWVTDTNNNRIQKWAVSEGTSSGVASTTIKVDGKVVDTTSPGCPTGSCSISREWILNAISSTTGQHSVEVTATDVSGLSSTKSLTFNVAKDATAPQITANASLYTAPEGWVEQDPYAYTASAADPGGYGNTSLVLKIDGQVVKTASQSCPDGSCQQTLSGSIDMAGYEGGAHPAELIASDGAGNSAKKAWTINVDPEGHISAEEATATLEAVEATSPVNLIGEAQEEEEYVGTAPGLGIEEVEGKLEATGTEVPTVIGTEPSEGVAMEILAPGALASVCSSEEEEPEESSEPCITQKELEELESGGSGTGLLPIEVIPIGMPGGPVNDIVGEGAALAPNTESSVDTITRPLYDGMMNFQAIRNSSAPETFTWRVNLAPEQELKLINDQHAEVTYAETERTAFSITAAPARDAIGSRVPTSLSVSGTDEVSLTIRHHDPSPAGGSFIYPVVAGTGWEGGFQTYISELPPPQPFPPTSVYWEGDNLIVGAPEALSGAEATISSPGELRKPYIRVRCGIEASYATGTGRPTDYTDCGNPFLGDDGEGVLWNAAIRGVFFYQPGQEVRHKGAIACAKWLGTTRSIDFQWMLNEAYECTYGPKTGDGNGGVSASAHHYLRAQAHWLLAHRGWCGDNCDGTANPWLWEDKALELHLWPSGSIERVY